MAKIYYLILTIFAYPQLALAHGVSEADKHAMLDGGLFEYCWLGAKHMVTGYDHLLFIFGVIFFLTKFSEIVKFITAFTIGHSITLIFATFMGITANAYLIDAVIALTVVYKGFDNIDGFRRFFKAKPPEMLPLVFIFGLIHGFGLSTRLQELPLNHDELLLDIISFNVGVELGQIAALTVMMVLLAGFRKTNLFAKFSFVSNVLLMLAGFALFGMQLHGYTHDRHHHVEGSYEDVHGDDHEDHGEHHMHEEEGHSHDEHMHEDHDHGHNEGHSHEGVRNEHGDQLKPNNHMHEDGTSHSH